ncbi:unnamed protein product [Closterium sp. Naga37s-1]|nr:unnamed protein product [Closterium sp. Naga37s-1]
MGAGLTALAATQLLPGATVHASERPSFSHGVLHVPPAAAHATSAGVAATRLESNIPAAISSSASSAAVSASWWWQKATADCQSQTASQMPSQVASQVASHAHSPLAYRSSHVYSGTQGREERGREGGKMETREEGGQYDGWTIVGGLGGMRAEWRGGAEGTEREVWGQKREEAGGGWELVAGGGTGRGVAREAERGMERGKDGGLAEGRAGEAGAAVRAQGERTACVAVTGESGQSRERKESRERGESRERWEQWERGECSERVQQQSMWRSGGRRSMDETHVLQSADQQNHAWQPPTRHQSHPSGHSPGHPSSHSPGHPSSHSPGHPSGHSPGHPSGYPLHHTSSSSLAPSAHIPFPPCSPGSSPSPSPSSTSSSLASSSAASASPCSPLRPMAPPRRTKRTDERSQCTTTRSAHNMTCAQEITEESAQETAPTGDSMMGSQCNALLTQPRDILPRAPPVTCFSSRATHAVTSSFSARPVGSSSALGAPLAPAPPASSPLDCAQPASGGAAGASAAGVGLWNEQQQQLEQKDMDNLTHVHRHHSQEYHHAAHAHPHAHGQGRGHAYELLSSPTEAAAVAEALCHSQSRAREAEQAAAEAESRQQWLEQLFWHECTRSYSFHQWAHMLQLQVNPAVPVEKDQLLMLIGAEAEAAAAAAAAAAGGSGISDTYHREAWGSHCADDGCASEPCAAGEAAAGDRMAEALFSERTGNSTQVLRQQQPLPHPSCPSRSSHPSCPPLPSPATCFWVLLSL